MNRGFYAILCGKLLGDGYLNKKKHARFQFRHCQSDYGYVLEQLKLFSNYLKFGPNNPLKYCYRDMRTQRTYTTYICQSITNPTLTEVMRIWYPSNTHKVIPKDFLREYFNEETLAIWYQDDGSLKSKRRIILSTECFTDDEINFLRKLIYDKYLIESSIDSQRRIDISNRRNVELFLICVSPFLSNSMRRKSLTDYYTELSLINMQLCNLTTDNKGSSKRTTIYLPPHIKSKLQETNSPSEVINSSIHVHKELNSIEGLLFRQKRIIKCKEESIKNKDRVPYTIYLDDLNYKGLKLLKNWTGIEISEYILMFLKESKVI